MPTIQVNLPNNVVAELFYVHDYPGGIYDYIQHARANSLYMKPNVHQIEETFWANLQANRVNFANQIPGGYDLIVRAPSNSGWHLPFLSAVCDAHPQMPCLHFMKDVQNAGQVKAFNNVIFGLNLATKVLIVDDVFSTGTMAGKVIDKLHQYGLAPNVPILIACPLRLPPPLPAADWEAAVDAMSTKPIKDTE